MSMGGSNSSNSFSRGVALRSAQERARQDEINQNLALMSAPADMPTGPSLPTVQDQTANYSRIIGANDLPLAIDTTSGAGKGGASDTQVGGYSSPQSMLYMQPSSQPQMFDNTGRLVDSTLLMQQAILGRQPQQRYQPLITPESYQNFYNMPSASYGGNAPLVSDYRTLAQKYKDDAAAAAEEAGGDGPGVDGGDGGYDPNAAVNLAPVTVIDVNTGKVVSVDPGGTTASGMPGSTLGVGTVSDDPTGPESEDGNGNIGVSVSPVSGATSVTGTDLGLLGTVGNDSNTGVTVSPVADQATVTGTNLGLLGAVDSGPGAAGGVSASGVAGSSVGVGTVGDDATGPEGESGGVGADAGGVSASGVAGSSVGIGTVGDDATGPDAGDGGGGGAECFVASTMVTDSDGIEKPISEFKIGDYVLSTDGMTYNKVKYVETSQTKRGEIIWSPDGREPFATYNHPMMVGDKWVSCDQKVTDQRYPWIKAVQASKPNTKMSDGETVYNLWVEGDGTYFVNGFATTSLIGDGGLMRVAIEQGLITEEDSRTIIHFTQRGSVIDMYGVHHLNLMLGKWNIKPLNKYACDVMLGKRNSLITGLAIKAVGLVTALADGVRIKFDRKSTQNATA